MNFFKNLMFWIFGIFEKKIQNIIANLVKMDLPIYIKCTNLIPKFQDDRITQKAQKTFQSWLKRPKNFVLLDTLGYLVLLRPNGLRQPYQIWHTSSHGSDASSCKILDTCLNFNYCFLQKMLQKCQKNSKIWVF